ncbi:cystathionine beta-lyase [Echinimonas agarilytica]|uniref:Cystathionine beta-lyase n=1 Tax=Echinimonas agarilytica TaxID=1215918 RepID=A0AA42B744_9GAMM|nr:cystathionine beta-lyase [Echinimonas agarilytica]MCM2679450.1 cystathionine beta-lyase [Echinimonas agarilytica]
MSKTSTKVVSAGRSKKWTKGVVNPSVMRASTVVFESVDEMKKATRKRAQQTLFYGRRGTDTSFAFQEAMTQVEGGSGCALYPCGTAAITSALLSFLKTGDHLLMVDTAYEPTRDFCNNMLAGLGIETTYYDPLIGADIESLMRPNTRVVFTESPGSNTMEIQDVPAISEVAHRHNAIVMLDNTWGSGVLFDPFAHGVDISIQAATKYIVGHSDVMIGTATATEACWPTLRENSYLLGQCTSPDDIYLAMRGLRTLDVRLKQHEANALKVAQWLETRPEVDHVRHPAFETCPGHEIWKRDFTGCNGLFSFVLNKGHEAATTAMLDGMKHFSMGYSWGGFESLILAVNGIQRLRTATQWSAAGPLIRLHIGLEDADDLIADLESGLERFNAAL